MNSTALRPQGSHGGITKRTGGRARVDRDGDLDMDGPSGGRGGRGRGNRNRGGRGGGAGAVSRGGRSGAGSIIPAGPTTGRTDLGQNKNRGIPARGLRNGTVSVSETLVEVRITGWKNSKGSAEEAIAFLERKSRIKLRKVRYTICSHGIHTTPFFSMYSMLPFQTFLGSELLFSCYGCITFILYYVYLRGWRIFGDRARLRPGDLQQALGGLLQDVFEYRRCPHS